MIQFKHPEYLYLLFLLLIPILIHLFQLRKFTKVNFTNVAILKILELQSRKSKNLKKYIILTLRMLALSALILAFTQPYIPASKEALNTPNYSIYLDNSFSMQMPSSKGNLLKQAQQELAEIIPEDANIHFFTNNASFKDLNSNTFKNELLKTTFSHQQLKLDNAIKKAEIDHNNASGKQKIIAVSDFQLEDEVDYNSLIEKEHVSLLQIKPQPKINFSIVNLKLNDERNLLEIELSASENNKEALQVSVWNQEQLLAKQLVEFQNTASQNIEISLAKEQINAGHVEIEDDALQYDNRFYFSINAAKKINVLSIYEEDASFLKRIFRNNEFKLNSYSIQNLDYSQIEKANFIVLNGLKHIPQQLQKSLREFSNKNQSFVVIPNEDANVSNYNSFLTSFNLGSISIKKTNQQKITGIYFEHPLLKNVFTSTISNFEYPLTRSHFSIQTKAKPIISYANQEAFLASSGKNYLFASSFSTENSNFVNSPLIVPLLYNMARESVLKPSIYDFTNTKNSYQINASIGKDEVLKLVKQEDVFIPQQQKYNQNIKLTTAELNLQAGTYQVKNKDSVYQYLSFNYPRTESNLNYLNSNKLKQQSNLNSISGFFENEIALQEVNHYWKILVIFALLFLILEMLSLRYLK
ncbi:BatA domain-containing protein [Psychroflexus salis]|uniref:Membrane protein n=1 Tax=Psychroflexus salis TaxID=1526574 RepID=A0A916ZR17_9FLAO|nr:BatA domain-containing protein [Psychroflexus salis]GGE09872.1 membrane protein [Psychroflexus salis]